MFERKVYGSECWNCDGGWAWDLPKRKENTTVLQSKVKATRNISTPRDGMSAHHVHMDTIRRQPFMHPAGERHPRTPTIAPSMLWTGPPDNNNSNQHCLVGVTLNSKADKPVALIFGSNWNLECGLLWREENWRTRRKTLRAGTRTNNKLNPHVTPDPEIGPKRQRWEASALTSAPSLHPQLMASHVVNH